MRIIENVFVFASYKEIENLELLISQFVNTFNPNTDAIILADDTGKPENSRIEPLISAYLKAQDFSFVLSLADTKTGRGSAIRRGFKIGIEKYPEAKFFFESDTDGSHRVLDLLALKDFEKCDFLIGSRYLSQSSISGWPLSRRIFSKLLNRSIPVLLGINSSDLTNGLRRYSKDSVVDLLEAPQENQGFIYLSETALVLKNQGVLPNEIPIHFENRINGASSVGVSEVFMSLKGILLLWKKRCAWAKAEF